MGLEIKGKATRPAIYLLVLLSLFCPAGCAKAPEPKPPIKIALSVWPGYAHAYIAEVNGIFKRNNVDVDLILKKTTPEALEMFTTGETDGCLGVMADVIMVTANGVPAKVVCVADFSDAGDVIIARPEIQSLSELAGKTISFEGVNTFSQIFVLSAINKAGLDESDVKFEHLYAQEVLTALEDNRIDAGHTWEPIKSQALKKGYKIIAKAGDYPGVITDILVFSSKIINERPDQVRAVVKSLFEARDYLREHRAQAIKIMADKMGMSAEEMASGIEGVHQTDLKENLALLTDPASSFYSSGSSVVDLFLKRGQLSSVVNIAELVDSRFIKELNKK